MNVFKIWKPTFSHCFHIPVHNRLSYEKWGKKDRTNKRAVASIFTLGLSLVNVGEEKTQRERERGTGCLRIVQYCCMIQFRNTDLLSYIVCILPLPLYTSKYIYAVFCQMLVKKMILFVSEITSLRKIDLLVALYFPSGLELRFRRNSSPPPNPYLVYIHPLCT